MKKAIVQATGAVLIMNLTSKILGLLRETFIANEFGAGKLTDAYLVAYTLPYFLQAILGFALVTVVVPIITRKLVSNDQEEAWHVGSSLLNLTAIALTVFTILGVVFAEILVKMTSPGFSPEMNALAAHLARIMFPAVVLMGIGMVVTGILNAYHNFFVPAFAPGMSNLIIIMTVIFFSSRYGIEGLAVGTLISFLGFLLIQLPLLWKVGFKYKWTFDWHHADVRQAGYTIMPIVLGVAVNQIYFAINRIFASGLAEGSISALNYANKLMNLPLGIFVAAVAVAVYPSLSEYAIKKDNNGMQEMLLRGLGAVSLITIPAAAGLMVLREPIVQLLFERGAFSHQDTLVTAQALFYFSLGLFPGAANMIITRLYYAVGNVKKPVIIGAISILANVIFSFMFKGVLNHAGLALANSLAAFVNMIFLWYGIKNYLPGLKSKGYLQSLFKMVIASLVMYGGIWLFMDLGQGFWETRLVLAVICHMGIGIMLYGLLVCLLKVDDIRYILEMVRFKLKNRS